MRISTSMMYEMGLAGVQRQTSDLLKTQQQVSSGRRIVNPSDDPVAAAKILDLTQSDGINTQYMSNGDAATSSLRLEESVLGSVTTLIQNVQSLAVSAGNAGLSNSDRASMATELSGRYTDLLGLANTMDSNGQYLFSGYKGATVPFSETAPGQVVYAGDQGQRMVQISASRQVPISDSGYDIFQRIKGGNGTFVASASGANTGAGIISPGTVLNNANWAAGSQDYSIRFAANTTVTAGATNTGPVTVSGGIVDQTKWNASGKSLNISVAAGATPGTFDYTISDPTLVPSSYTVNYNPSTQNPLKVKLDGSGTTINAGVDLVLSGTPVAGDTFTLGASATPGWTYDIIDNKTNTSLLSSPASASGWSSSWRTYTSGQAISLVSQGSEPKFDFGVSAQISGDPAAGDQFNIKASTSQDLFSTLSNLITTLKAGVTPGGSVGQAKLSNGLSTALSNLNGALDNVLTVRAAIGARIQEVDAVKNMGADLTLQYQQSISQLRDVDYNTAITDLTRQQAGLEAAQKSFVKVQGLSLFSLL